MFPAPWLFGIALNVAESCEPLQAGAILTRTGGRRPDGGEQTRTIGMSRRVFTP